MAEEFGIEKEVLTVVSMVFFMTWAFGTLFFGGFEHKVGQVAWHPSGRWCGAAGGRTPVLWDLGDAGDAPPVRQNARATTLERQTATVAWLGFSDHGLLATAATNGQLLLYDVNGTQGEVTGRASVQSPEFAQSSRLGGAQRA